MKTWGFYGIQDIGISSVRMERGKRIKSYISVPGERKGIFTIIGGAPHRFESLKYAPPDTGFFRCFDLNLAAVLQEIRRVTRQTTGETGLRNLNANLANIGQNFGFDIEQILNSLDGEFILMGYFDQGKKISFPGKGGETISFSTPKAAILARVKDATLYDALKNFFQKTGITCKEDNIGELKKFSIEIPGGGEAYASMVFAFKGNHVFFSSHPDYLDKILSTAKGSVNLGNSEEFKKFTAGLPQTGNELFYANASFSREIRSISETLLKNQMQINAPAIRRRFPAAPFLMKLLENTGEQGGMAGIRINEPEGIYGEFYTSGGYLESVLSVGVISVFHPVGALTLHNIPVYQSASTIKRVKGDLCTMATGLEAYNVDWNAYPPSGDMESIVQQGPAISTHASLFRLTTPIAYITRIKKDPFSENGETPYWYFKPTKERDAALFGQNITWILWGVGPDGKPNIATSMDFIAPRVYEIIYDPTNGVNSSGDIIRTNLGLFPIK